MSLVAVVAALQFRPRLTSAILSKSHTRAHTRSTHLRRARYLRAVHVEYCPFTAGSCGPGFLSLVRTPRVAEVAEVASVSSGSPSRKRDLAAIVDELEQVVAKASSLVREAREAM